MNKMIKKLTLTGFGLFLFAACSADDPAADNSLNASGSVVEVADITRADLLGTWNLISMTADVPVNLNPAEDDISSKNILDETHCFDSMFFTFDAAGKITTGQAKLDFGPQADQFKCGYGEYSASYAVSGSQLEVIFDLNGNQVSRYKTIGITRDGNKSYLRVSLEDYEAAEYVSDPGNTVASDIGRIEMVYKRQ